MAVYARLLGTRRPDLVREIITLGSPVRLDVDLTNPLLHQLSGKFLDLKELLGLRDELMEPLPDSVRETNIFSTEDAAVHWSSTIDQDERAVHTEVRGTHTGLIVNSEVYQAIAETLADNPQEGAEPVGNLGRIFSGALGAMIQKWV